MVGWEQAMGEGVANEEGAEMNPSGMMLKGVGRNNFKRGIQIRRVSRQVPSPSPAMKA